MKSEIRVTGWLLRLGLLLGLCPGLIMAGPPETACKWNALAALVVHHKIDLVAPPGVYVQGKALAVEADGLRLRVTKTSDPRLVGKGERVIPRGSVTLLHLTTYRKSGRLLCTLGALGLTAGIVASRNIDLHEGAAVILVPALSATGVAGAGVAGYFIGKRIDRRTTDIRIVPD